LRAECILRSTSPVNIAPSPWTARADANLPGREIHLAPEQERRVQAIIRCGADRDLERSKD
jgi:hypothetical protein